MIKTLRHPLLALVVAGLLLFPVATALAAPIPAQGGDDPDPSFWEEEAPGQVYGPKAETLDSKPADDEPKLQADLSDAGVDAQGVGPAAPEAGWIVIENEGFEGVWPDAGWVVVDYNGPSQGGTYVWDDTSKRHAGATGAWSAHPTDGVTPYTNDLHTTMTYGPFSLVGATDAKFKFSYFLDTEPGFDFFSWEYSCDNGASWVSQKKSGRPAVWKTVTVKLKPCLGKSSVLVQFGFISESSYSFEGAYVDNVLIQKYQ